MKNRDFDSLSSMELTPEEWQDRHTLEGKRKILLRVVTSSSSDHSELSRTLRECSSLAQMTMLEKRIHERLFSFERGGDLFFGHLPSEEDRKNEEHREWLATADQSRQIVLAHVRSLVPLWVIRRNEKNWVLDDQEYVFGQIKDGEIRELTSREVEECENEKLPVHPLVKILWDEALSPRSRHVSILSSVPSSGSSRLPSSDDPLPPFRKRERRSQSIRA